MIRALERCLSCRNLVRLANSESVDVRRHALEQLGAHLLQTGHQVLFDREAK